MKAIFCEICGTITSPGSQDMSPRSCECGLHRTWWVNGAAGILRVQFMGAAADPETGSPAGVPRVWVLGISNSLLHHPSLGMPSAVDIEEMLDQTPETYIFRRTRSNVIRIRPGQSSDTGWAVFRKE